MGCSLTEEVHLQLATNCDETQDAGAVGVVAEDWGHCVRVTEEHAEVSSRVLSLDQQEGVNSREATSASAVIIDSVLSRGPHGEGAL